MEQSSFYLYMSIVASIALIVNIIGMVSSFTNAFKIQKPWFEDYKKGKEPQDITPSKRKL